MSGSNSSAPGSSAVPEAASPLSLTVHSMPSPDVADVARRTASGRLKMLLVLAICAAPVIASYLMYYVVRPMGRANYAELIEPVRPIPPSLPLVDLQGHAVDPLSLRQQWLLVVVAGARCDAQCEKLLWLQRQLREMLGRDADRLDKVWLIDDVAAVRPETLQAVVEGEAATVLRTDRSALTDWLEPAAGHALEQHMYIVDPLGHWMMRVPAQPDPMRVKRDLERLMRASAGWDQPGRP
jgi:hypothetical protein